MTPLPTRGMDDDPAASVADRCARVIPGGLDTDERAAAMTLRDGFAEDGSIDRSQHVMAASKGPDSRADEELERDRRRHRVSRQAEHQHGTSAAWTGGRPECER